MIDEITIKKVKDAANVKDVIGDFYTLKRDGVNWTCLCPFHADKHMGSFKISEAKNIYTCYSCGAHGGPVDFLMRHENMTFIEAIKWLGAKYGIPVEGANEYADKVKHCKPHAPVPPLPMLKLPVQYVKSRMPGVEDNTLVKWIYSLRWSDEQRKRIPQMLRNYQVGHSAKGGHTIFWQIDEIGQVHTGKMMLYKPDGHRDKVSQYNFDWIHSALLRAGQLDPMEAEMQTCYFGQHLMNVCPMATINIVESEKTALLCAIYFGDIRNNLWIATGGLNFLNKQKLLPFIRDGRVVCLYPDHDGIEKWKEKKREINYDKLRINTDIITRYWKPEDGEKADVADILVRILNTPTTLQSMREECPWLDELIERFDLIEIK